MTGDSTNGSDGQRDEPIQNRDHLQDLEPGKGCAGIWEHLSEQRD